METKRNLELKHRCDDFTKIREVLEEIGAEKEVAKSQKDYFFNLPEEKEKLGARMKLRIESGEMSLIYYERPDFVADNDTPADIALLKADQSTLDFCKRSLGVQAIVEKEREVWRKDHTVFHLDEVQGVGKIFEIEVQCADNVTEADEELFFEYQNKLSQLLGEVVTGSNVDLVRMMAT